MIPGLFSRNKETSKPKEEKESPFRGSSIEEKIKEIILKARFEAMQDDVRRARVYYRTVLAYRGYFNLGPWDDVNCTYAYDPEDWTDFGENRFRRNVLINTGLLIRMEPTPVIRPGSESPQDLEAAIANQNALEIIHENIGYDQLKADKALFKTLFGNVFVYSDYQTDRRLGTIMVPKFKYETTELPGAAYCAECGSSAEMETMLCPDCGYPMEQVPPMPTEMQVPDGFDERVKGEEFSIAFSPLEVKVRSKVQGGLRNAPYLLRITREDIDGVQFVYPDLNINRRTNGQSYNGGSGGEEMSLNYQETLAALAPNIDGGQNPYWAQTQYFDQIDACQAWIRPQLYRGDKELLKECPDGFLGVMCDGELAEYRPESLDDHWTHEIYIRNPGSLYGDGMVDSVPVNRLINRVDQLQIQHLEHDTIPLRLFDSDMIVETDISNDPSKKWLAVNTGPDKPLNAAVFDLKAQQLSNDVNILKANLYQTDQDISGASDVPVGGANTPYSTQALANEQIQLRFAASIYMNSRAVQAHTRQVLKIAEKNWIDPRKRTTEDSTTGKPTSVSIVGADLSRGEISIKVLTNDFKPKNRGEALQAMDYMKGFGVDPTANPRQRLAFFERVGMPLDGDMLSTQTRRTYRQIQKMAVGQPVAPEWWIDDPIVQMPTIQEFMASKEGEELNDQAKQAVFAYYQSLMQLQAMKQDAMMAMGLAPELSQEQPQQGPGGGAPQAKPKGTPGGQPGQQGGGNPRSGELAQSPVPDAQKQTGAPLPAGARQR